MIGIVIIAHGDLGKSFHQAVEHVVDPQPQMESMSILPDDTAEGRMADLEAAVKRVDKGEGVIILTDLFGGTPSNLAISLLENPKVEVLAGVNLPTLVKLVEARKSYPLKDCVTPAEEAGKKYLTNARRFLS
jgi:PTS system mannose-specific IIA component